MSKLENCHGCGREAETSCVDGWWKAYCKGCHLSTGMQHTERDAIIAWNRAQDFSISEKIGEARMAAALESAWNGAEGIWPDWIYRMREQMALLESLAKFKAYVHRRLDEAGIPADPESPHKTDGCRIGGRLDIALNRETPGEKLAEAVLAREAAIKERGETSANTYARRGANDLVACREDDLRSALSAYRDSRRKAGAA